MPQFHLAAVNVDPVACAINRDFIFPSLQSCFPRAKLDFKLLVNGPVPQELDIHVGRFRLDHPLALLRF